jgi:hypothetical protein
MKPQVTDTENPHLSQHPADTKGIETAAGKPSRTRPVMPVSGRVRLPRKGRQPPECCLSAGALKPQNTNRGMKIDCGMRSVHGTRVNVGRTPATPPCVR